MATLGTATSSFSITWPAAPGAKCRGRDDPLSASFTPFAPSLPSDSLGPSRGGGVRRRAVCAVLSVIGGGGIPIFVACQTKPSPESHPQSRQHGSLFACCLPGDPPFVLLS
eukprot:07775_2